MFQIPPLETRKRNKINVVFDEGIQILVYSEKCIWNSLFKVLSTLGRTRSTELTGQNSFFLWALVIEFNLEICRRNKNIKNF